MLWEHSQAGRAEENRTELGGGLGGVSFVIRAEGVLPVGAPVPRLRPKVLPHPLCLTRDISGRGPDCARGTCVYHPHLQGES